MNAPVVSPEPVKAVRRVPPPMAMLAELTHRCPLKCPYCSNPLEMVKRADELTTEEWTSVLRQAAAMGVLHVHFSGGEPAARRDLEDLVTVGREVGLYTNLITSGVGLTEARVKDLSARGLDHVQLSIQGTDSETADLVGGYRGGFDHKMKVAAWIGAEGLPLTVNAVMHRRNLHKVRETIHLAVELGARRIEIANTQIHGWAVKNRAALLPTRAMVDACTAVVMEERERLKGTLVIDYVPPDHHSIYPKACMGGWGRVGINIEPNGKVLPCHAAATIPHLTFETVREKPLAWIWNESSSFNAYRGTDWMPEPCRSCERKTVDFGGCRCQAMAYAGDASATDPMCIKSPLRDTIRQLTEAESEVGEIPAYEYRTM
ncbi:pyrroloquinoline quinone biosynthesis protein PqqE [Chthonobacter rhizosphaerae]|uniref:pyrroloquinoline quinone biosynthesis protein PqqE n=1 Tax=Chthonobacter rhizosphaerae TaxID=2735553 RepID=UPI0015EF3A5E|nr:pyrroloquinoline quinone biosynthesis protein PqqE [Chthonobacter rhizosphaerae]